MEGSATIGSIGCRSNNPALGFQNVVSYSEFAPVQKKIIFLSYHRIWKTGISDWS